jgi:hypothetical protein
MVLVSKTVRSGKTNPHLLGGWLDIVDDIERVATAIDKVPAHCACGDGMAHVGGHCACCAGGAAARGCDACEALVAGVTERFEALWADTWRFSPVLHEFASWRPDHDDMRRALDTLAVRTFRLVREVEGVQVAPAERGQGCPVDHLARLRDHVNELRDATKHLDQQW